MGTPNEAPIFYVLVQPQGQPTTSRVDTTDTVLSFEYEDDEKKANMLKLEVDNWDLTNFDDPIWKPGNTVVVTWGYHGQVAPQRECIIQKVTGSVKLTITAMAKSILMNKVVKTRSFSNITRGDLVHLIATEYGYGDSQIDIDSTDEVYETISQARMTDAQLIKKLADAEHFEFYVDFDGLHWHERRLGKKPLRLLQYYLPPDVGDIIDFDVENDVFAKPAAVTTKGFDPNKKTIVTGDASNGKTTRDALQPTPEMVDQPTGDITLQPNLVSSDTRPTTETSSAQVKKEADGAFKRSILSTVKMKINMVGDPGIAAKSVIEVRGISKRLSGLYYINKVVHHIDSSGYKLAIDCMTDGTSGHSQNLIPASPGGSAGGASAGGATPAALAACNKDYDAKNSELADAQKRGDAVNITRLTTEAKAIKTRCDAISAAISKAKTNDGTAEGADKNASTQFQRVDIPSGETVIEYHPDGTSSKEKK